MRARSEPIERKHSDWSRMTCISTSNSLRLVAWALVEGTVKAMNEFEEFARRARRTDLGALDAVVIAIGCALAAADIGLEFHGVAILAGLLFLAHGWAALKRGDVVDVARDNPYLISSRTSRSKPTAATSSFSPCSVGPRGILAA